MRLDEIVWGGVTVDGILPLEHPKLIKEKTASYLRNNDLVLGIFLNGEARAYPKRILAWNEFFNNTVGEIDVTCSYCSFVDPLFFMSKESTKTSLTSGLVVFLIDPTNLCTIAKPVRFGRH